MSSSEVAHPTIETLLAFMEMPQADQYIELRAHLLACQCCRESVEELREVQAALPGLSMSELVSENKILLSDSEVAAFANDQLEGDKLEQFESLLEESSEAMKSTLHYLSHSAAMENAGLKADISASPLEGGQRKVVPIASAKQNPKADDSFVSRSLVQRIADWRQPVWINAPIAASIALLVFYLSATNRLAFESNVNQPMVAHYQDEQSLYWEPVIVRQKLPGLGFFHESIHESNQETSQGSTQETTNERNDAENLAAKHDFLAIDVKLNDHDLSIKWPEIKDASNYRFTLYITEEKGSSLLYEQKTQVNALAFKLDAIHYGKRYEWQLEGDANSGERYQAKGGFVISLPVDINR